MCSIRFTSFLRRHYRPPVSCLPGDELCLRGLPCPPVPAPHGPGRYNRYPLSIPTLPRLRLFSMWAISERLPFSETESQCNRSLPRTIRCKIPVLHLSVRSGSGRKQLCQLAQWLRFLRRHHRCQRQTSGSIQSALRA